MKINCKKMFMNVAVPVIMSAACVALAGETGGGGPAFTAVEKLITDAKELIVTISTPAALIGVGIGAVTMKMAGGGDDSNQKRSMGKKAISSSIIAWTAINGLMLILDTIKGYF